jgi:hypothetical protein
MIDDITIGDNTPRASNGFVPTASAEGALPSLSGPPLRRSTIQIPLTTAAHINVDWLQILHIPQADTGGSFPWRKVITLRSWYLIQ